MPNKLDPYDVQLIELVDLRPGPGNLRDGQDGWPEGDPELAASIKTVGVLEPLIVREVVANPGASTERLAIAYEVVAGHRRAAAAKLAELKVVPAFVRQLTDTKAIQIALIENLQREDLSPIEEARGLRQLLDTGMPQTTAAKEIGRSQSHVSKRLELLKLPPHAQAYLDAGKLRVADALALAKLDEPTVNNALHQIEALQYRRAGEVEQLIKRVAERAKPHRGGKAEEAKPVISGREQTWELSSRELVVFRELARRRITVDGARKRLIRSASLRELEWDPKDLADLLALASGDTKARRRTGRPGKGGKR